MSGPHDHVGQPLVAAVFVRDRSHRYASTIRSLLLAGVDHVIVGAPALDTATAFIVDERTEAVVATSAAAHVNTTSDRFDATVIALDEPVIVARDAFEHSQSMIELDARIATVNYWSNYAGHLSFPDAVPSSHQGSGTVDAETGTQRLRSSDEPLEPVTVPLASGPLVSISRRALTACGPLIDSGFDELAVSVAEFGLRAAGRGFVSLLDPTTFVVRPFDLAAPTTPVLTRGEVRGWLHDRHPMFPAAIDPQLSEAGNPIERARAVSRARVSGLRVLIDGSVMGAWETGTQVHLMSLVSALARRDDVERIVVSLPGPTPPYAPAALASPARSPGTTGDALRSAA